jgi:hypothetical protein
LHVAAAPRFESESGDDIRYLIDTRCAGQVGAGIFHCERQAESLARRSAPADLRLPEQHNSVQSFEVDAVGLGFRV